MSGCILHIILAWACLRGSHAVKVENDCRASSLATLHNISWVHAVQETLVSSSPSSPSLPREWVLATSLGLVVLGVTSLFDAKTSSVSLGLLTMALGILGVVGLIPAFIAFYQTEEWFTDAVARIPREIVHSAMTGGKIIEIHVFFSFLWVILGGVQAYLVFTRSGNDMRKQLHRKLGYLAICVDICMILSATAVSIRFYGKTPFRPEAVSLWVTIAMIAFDLAYGYGAARKGYYDEHKVAMVMTFFWPAVPSLGRMSHYIQRAFGCQSPHLLGCHLTTSLWEVWVLIGLWIVPITLMVLTCKGLRSRICAVNVGILLGVAIYGFYQRSGPFGRIQQ